MPVFRTSNLELANIVPLFTQSGEDELITDVRLNWALYIREFVKAESRTDYAKVGFGHSESRSEI